MKKTLIITLLIISICPITVFAQRGCCSRHGGVSNSCSNGRQVCNDGTISPSCTCEDYSSYTPSSNSTNSYAKSYSSTQSVSIPSYKYGCTNSQALNYDSSATRDDGSCIEKIYGCMDSKARNYDNTANVADSSCEYESEIKETKKIKYKIKYQYTDKLEYNDQKIKQKGKDGIKEITYKLITDESGNQISKEKISETVISKPVNKIIEKSSKEDPESTKIFIIWLIVLILILIYSSKYKKDNLLINKIKIKKGIIKLILYFIYIISIVGPFIDLILIIPSIIKKKK